MLECEQYDIFRMFFPVRSSAWYKRLEHTIEGSKELNEGQKVLNQRPRPFGKLQLDFLLRNINPLKPILIPINLINLYPPAPNHHQILLIQLYLTFQWYRLIKFLTHKYRNCIYSLDLVEYWLIGLENCIHRVISLRVGLVFYVDQGVLSWWFGVYCFKDLWNCLDLVLCRSLCLC